MAISTIGSHFMYGTGTGTLAWTELFKFKTDPPLQDPPTLLDATSQADHARISIFGLAENDTKQFTCNFEPEIYDAIKALEGQELNLSMWFGDTFDSATSTYTPTGSFAKFTGKGRLQVTYNGGEVNAVRDMTVTLAVTVPFVKEA